MPLDQVTGGYGKIETTYRPQKPDGNLDAARLRGAGVSAA
jgi:hypothetical protein